jgi:uncharacterized protein (DUF2062 family)
LKEWAANGNNPQNPKELYNLRHASARNVVERIFALGLSSGLVPFLE